MNLSGAWALDILSFQISRSYGLSAVACVIIRVRLAVYKTLSCAVKWLAELFFALTVSDFVQTLLMILTNCLGPELRRLALGVGHPSYSLFGL